MSGTLALIPALKGRAKLNRRYAAKKTKSYPDAREDFLRLSHHFHLALEFDITEIGSS